MTSWLVRAAGPEDADDLVALERAAFGPASWGEAGVRGGLTAPFVTVLLACEKNSPVAKGFALWRCLGGEGEILTLGVLPAEQKRGAGEALLRCILGQAASASLKAMFLEVDAGNEAARALYGKHGFVKVAERRGYYRNGADALILRKDL